MDVFWYIYMFSTDPVTQFYICKLTFVNIIQRYYLLKSKAMLLFHYFLLSQNRIDCLEKKHTNDAFWYALYYIIELYNLKSFQSRAGKHVIKCHLFKLKKNETSICSEDKYACKRMFANETETNHRDIIVFVFSPNIFWSN